MKKMNLYSRKPPHTLGVTYLETIQTDLEVLLAEYKEDFVWLDEILDACKKALVTPEVQLLPKTPSSKRTRQRIVRKQEPESKEPSDADDEETTPPSRKTRQTRQKASKTATQKTRNTRGKKQNDESIELPRDKISPKTTSTNLSKMSDCSELELSHSEMTPVAQNTLVNNTPIKTVQCSVKLRASAYENMLVKRSSHSPSISKKTPVNDKSCNSIIITPDLIDTPETVKLNKTASYLASKNDQNLNGSFIKEKPGQKRRSSRKSLKVLASKVRRISVQNHHPKIETYSSEEVEVVNGPKRKPRTRLCLKKKETFEVMSTEEESEVRKKESSSVDNDEVLSESKTANQSPVKTVTTPIPKPRTPKTKTSQTSILTSNHIIQNDETFAAYESDIPMVTESSDEFDNNIKISSTTIPQKYSPNRDRDSGISGVLSTQSSAVSLKNLDFSETEKSTNSRSTRSKSRHLQSSPILEAGSDTDEVFNIPELNESKTNRKRAVDECEDSPVPNSKRSCIGTSVDKEIEQDQRTPVKSAVNDDSLNSDEYESMENDSDEYSSPTCPGNKIVKPSLWKNSTSRPNKPSNLMSGFMHSFIKRNTPVKPTKVSIDQKKKEILEKEKKNEDRVQRKREILNRQMQERKRLREERMKKASELRQEHDKLMFNKQNENVKKMEERLTLKDKLKAEKLREDRMMKQNIRLQKLKELEERRKQDEEERLRKKIEQEEEDRRQRELFQKKKDCEEQERQRRLAEEKQRQEERTAEAERERQLDNERQLQLELDRQKEAQRLKEEREKQLAREKADRERLELEKKKEREIQLQKDMIKLREMEMARLAKIAAEKDEEQQPKERIQKQMEKPTTIMKPITNTTHTLSDKPFNHLSYDISQDYNISNLHSDDSTDDEDAPRKKIPQWAQGTNLKAALINQEYHPPKLDKIFAVVPDLDLNDVFIKRKPRFNKRTSSAIWDSPLLKPCQTAQFHI